MNHSESDVRDHTQLDKLSLPALQFLLVWLVQTQGSLAYQGNYNGHISEDKRPQALIKLRRVFFSKPEKELGHVSKKSREPAIRLC